MQAIKRQVKKRRKEKRKKNIPFLARLPLEPVMDGGAETD